MWKLIVLFIDRLKLSTPKSQGRGCGLINPSLNYAPNSGGI
jgi:hypothetical protein